MHDWSFQGAFSEESMSVDWDYTPTDADHWRDKFDLYEGIQKDNDDFRLCWVEEELPRFSHCNTHIYE